MHIILFFANLHFSVIELLLQAIINQYITKRCVDIYFQVPPQIIQTHIIGSLLGVANP